MKQFLFIDRLSQNQIWWIVISFHPCNPASAVLLYRMFWSNKVAYLVAFSDI